jgi:hypothetical protein
VIDPSVKCVIGASSLNMSDSESGEEEEETFDVPEWISKTRISEAGAKILDKNLIHDLDTLLLFRESDVEFLRLSLPDALRFRAGIAKLHQVRDLPVDSAKPAKPVTPAKPAVKVPFKPVVEEVDSDPKLYSLKEVERLLAGKTAVLAGKAVNASTVKSESSEATGGNLNNLTALVSLFTGAATATPAASLLSSLAAFFSASAGASGSTDVRDLMRDLLNVDGTPTNSRGEKTLLPIHFLSCVR